MKITENWSKKSVVIFSSSKSTYGVVLRDMARNLGWSVAGITHEMPKLREYLSTGAASIVFIDDCVDLPGVAAVRHILKDPICALHPMLCFLSEVNKNEALSLRSMGKPVVVEKPVSPMRFVRDFKGLVKVW